MKNLRDLKKLICSMAMVFIMVLSVNFISSLQVSATDNKATGETVNITIDNSVSHLGVRFYPDTNNLDYFEFVEVGATKTYTVSKDSIARIRLYVQADGHYVPDTYTIEGATKLTNDDRVNFGWCRAAYTITADAAKTLVLPETPVCTHPYADPNVRWGYYDCGDGTHAQSCTLCSSDIPNTTAKHTLSEMTATEYVNWYYADNNFAGVPEENLASMKANLMASITEKLGVDANTKIKACTICEHWEKIENTVPQTPETSIKATKVKLNKSKADIVVGKTLTLKATIIPGNASDKKIIWSSSDKKIATVSNKGVVKGIKAGTAVITAKTSNGKKVTCKVTVKKPTVKLQKTKATIKVGKTITIKIKSVFPKNDAVKSYTSSNKKIVTVTGKGVVKGKKAGTATITVKMKSGAKATFKVTVKKK